jgi:putative intracellular protease/amidase
MPCASSPAPLEQASRAAEQRTRADVERGARTHCLPADPAEDPLVLHERFLAVATGNVEDVEPGRVSERRVREQTQALDVAHRIGRPAIEAIGRVGDAGQDLERSGQVDLIDSVEDEGADFKVCVMRDHRVSFMQIGVGRRHLGGHDLAIMPTNPQYSPNLGRVDLPRPVEVLVFPAVQMLDVAGPLQVFATANDIVTAAGGGAPYALRVVAKDGASVTASAGLGLAAEVLSPVDATLDTLVVAGGQGVQLAAADAALVDWVRARSAAARRTASVCTGAFLLAAAGVLDGRRAATHWSVCAELARSFPAVCVEPDPIFCARRFGVDLGGRDRGD